MRDMYVRRITLWQMALGGLSLHIDIASVIRRGVLLSIYISVEAGYIEIE
jgi:hypothetical protein